MGFILIILGSHKDPQNRLVSIQMDDEELSRGHEVIAPAPPSRWWLVGLTAAAVVVFVLANRKYGPSD